MSPVEVVKEVRETPFKPFRIYMDNGSDYAVPHPDFIFVTYDRITVVTNLGENEIPDQTMFLAPEHISRLERIPEHQVSSLQAS